MTDQGISTVEAFMQVMDSINMLADSVISYRKRLEEGGFCPRVAEMMSANLHETLVSIIFAGGSGSTASHVVYVDQDGEEEDD